MYNVTYEMRGQGNRNESVVGYESSDSESRYLVFKMVIGQSQKSLQTRMETFRVVKSPRPLGI